MAMQNREERYTVVPLSVTEERELGWAILNDNCHDSREKMIMANLHLVSSVACRFAGRGVTLGELIERGKLGLVRAVEHYDPAQGVRFSTPARWWIKEAIRQALRAVGKTPVIEAAGAEYTRRQCGSSLVFGRPNRGAAEPKPVRGSGPEVRGAGLSASI